MSTDESSRDVQVCEYFLKPGFIVVNPENTLVRVVVGNCVAVTLHDRLNRFGGMNHFLFPEMNDRRRATAQYGNIAVHALVAMILDMGADRDRIEAQIFGGASHREISDDSLGEDNIEIARQTLKRLDVPVVSEDVGGYRGRKILYHTGTNETVVMKVENLRESDWVLPGQDNRFDHGARR